jgi:two-component system LytT family response regulator
MRPDSPTGAPIRTLVVDDEPVARETLTGLIAREPDLELVGEGAGRAASRLARRLKPELVFLDVRMPGLDGLALLAGLPEPRPLAVMVTAFEEHAIAAFDAGAVDYLLKPFSDERFAHSVGRARAILRARQSAPGAPVRRRLAVPDGPGTRLIECGEIDWIEAAGSWVRVHASGRHHLVRGSVASLQRVLDPERFFRVHRSALVNLDRVKSLAPWSHGDWLLELHDGTELRLSRTRRRGLERLVGRLHTA